MIGMVPPPGSLGDPPSGDWDDARSENSSGVSMAPSSVFSHLQAPAANAGFGGFAIAKSSSASPDRLQQDSADSLRALPIVAANGSGASAVKAAAMRLGIKLEARGDVRRLVDVLQQRLSVAGRDLQVREQPPDWGLEQFHMCIQLWSVFLLPCAVCHIRGADAH